MTGAPAVHRFDVLPSTQDALHELAQAGAPVGTAVVADVQTLGRGSRGRGWESPAGGLWMSVLCRPDGDLAMEVLSLRVALAVVQAVEQRHPDIRLELKWPNDVMVAGRKLGGILCEARWHGATLGWVAVGIGINVTNPIPEAVRSSAIALASVTGGASPHDLAEPIARAVTESGRAQGHLTEQELGDFRDRDWLLGKRLVAPGEGVAEGLSHDGALTIRGADGAVHGHRTGPVTLAR